MATCPACKASSRVDPTFEIVDALVAKPLGTWSLAGVMPKTSAVSALRLVHRGPAGKPCGWSILGRRDGDHFVADPELNAWAAAGAGIPVSPSNEEGTP